MDEFLPILTKVGVSTGEAIGIAASTWLLVQALKKSISWLQGTWNVAFSIAIAGTQAVILYQDWRAWVAVAVFCGIAGASGGWQAMKDLIDRARGKDTNVPDNAGATRKEAGLL